MWRLREVVRAAGCDGAARLLTRAPGYLLDVDGDQVAVVRFERLVRTAGSQPPEQAAVLYGALTASSTATPAYGADADRLVTHAAVLRRELGASRFAAAIARGAALGDDGAVPFASAALTHLRP